MKQIKGTEAKRALTLSTTQTRELQVDQERRTVELAFSSETPYERWWGVEILDHSPEAIDLSRLQSGGAVLVDHDTRDQVGVVESVRIDDDRVARAVVRFSRSQRGQDIYNDIIDGIRQNVSVGYFIEDLILESRESEIETYRVTRWQPFEISIVSVPADPSVGVGRSHEPNAEGQPTENTAETKTDDAVTDGDDLGPISTAADIDANGQTLSEAAPATQTNENQQKDLFSMSEQTVDVVTQERTRIKDLTEIGQRFGAMDLAQRCINEGRSVAELNAMILERKGFDAKPAEGTTELGLTDKEKRDYSFRKLLNALANPNDREAQRAAGFELEVGAEAARKAKKDARGIIVPNEILRRAHSAGSPADGGNLIANDLLSGSFIDILQNRLSIMNAGATMLTGLEGNIAIPRQSGGAAAFWIAENGEPTGSSATFDQIALTPKTVGAFTEVSRKLLQQASIDVETFIRMELIRVMALELDRAALNGSGINNQPLGVLNVSGIGSVSIGNGLSWGKLIDLQTAVAVENADLGTLRYLTNAKVRGRLKQTEVTPNSGRFIMAGDTIDGYQTIVSNQVPANGGAGSNESTILFGNFADLLIGMWGGLDLQVNPYSLDKSGAVRVTAFQDVDTVVRRPESFAVAKDVITG